MADTVENAVSTPDVEQPWAELGLSADEYQHIREILGRRPTGGELAMYSVMWSEHCSYKSSKKYLRRFGDLPQRTPLGPLLAGIGDNAGVVDIGNGLAVTFKAESHNHPSYVEPHQGAATGVGGIVRDIMAMGARPIGVMNALAFGPLDRPDTARVLPGVVSGIADYGNCLGLPTIGGQTLFDPTYYGNPLVNALCVGVLRHEDLQFAKASGVGNLVILFGAATGGDGIGGASILASESFAAGGESKRPSVQVGDPFMEKLLIECTLDLFNAGVVEALQDFGAAGISCATSELASAGDGGMHIELDRVPLRDPNLAPEEILMSESQERMAAVVRPDQLDKFMEICEHWGVAATVIGEVTDTGRLHVDWHGERIVDVDPHTVAHDGPVLDMPSARPWWIDELNGNDANSLPRDNSGEGLAGALLALVGSPHLCDRSWITDQYDRFVRGNTVLAQPNDAGMIRVDEETNLGIALSVDANGRQTTLNPYLGAQLALCEAYRNVAVSGATPVAVTDCLNYGSPYDPDVMWQFDETVLGLVDGCRELGVPVTGGNVSLHNRTGDESIRPTPLVGVLGVIDDVRTRIPSAFGHDGDAILLLGVTKCEFGGSVYDDVIHAGHLGGMPPMPNLPAEKALAAVMGEAAKRGLLSSAHDLSDGGLSQALVESSLLGGLGVSITLPEGEPSVVLFSESPARAIVSLSGADYREFTDLCQEHGVPVVRIGEVIDHGKLEVNGLFSLSLDEIDRTWRKPIPAAMGE
ncbi:phosphoribosylformylglycinamidine synthase subunit PurL [Cutibacterium sp.]|uniref:phosphoribosylformylglycinamidine synthase subunit PurL n=1 Tax=Cutibacterium sp. TaxID=1912221 RepID=UPI0026DC540E|nr:phosphoribosylformylglycinamidine synthase subunit PurL [Cutibacterium sp.]MDO4412215.1 phosphoribosylformylglycinamidine synthase subunit PurL [Cutibacterium sp.]